ncbi:DCL family protein [Vibrio parahaemolyticus]|nr:DCL family protein [Vibrio parahaemolyticus]EJG0740274.1 DCL family protein [Vibrio parahaemolyticus]EJG0918874.1 DCL family protein [Vibrio parahaemolyticus]
MAKPISFGQFKFGTRKACEEDARRRINSYTPGSLMTLDDKAFFEALFTLHSEYDEKVGCGIKDIEVGLDFHRNKCLFIIRNDNSRVVISWRHCVKPYTKKMVVSYAFRRAVKNTVMTFKNEAISNGAICPKLGINLTFDNSHVSYASISFDDMLTNFLTENGLTYESVELIDPEYSDTDQRGKLANHEVMESWQKYHQSRASFELLSIEANLSK